jgi:ABC-2 type transport system permease protein
MDVLMQGLGALPKAIGDSQRAGTFEPMLLAPITAGDLIVSLLLFPLLFSLFRMALLIGFGAIVLGFWHHANPFSVLAVLVPAQLSFVAMGALSGAFIILIKQGDPVRVAFTGVTAILGGVFFPVDAMPDWMQPVTTLIPLTHALTGIREGMAGGSPVDVLPQIAVLSAMTGVLLPLGIVSFRWAMKRAKREGSLGEY